MWSGTCSFAIVRQHNFQNVWLFWFFGVSCVLAHQGPSFLVFPVLQFQQRTMQCYLPTGGASGKFVDFWSGEPHVEGSTVTVPLLLDHIPVFVKAGSIIPLGPHLQVRRLLMSLVLMLLWTY